MKTVRSFLAIRLVVLVTFVLGALLSHRSIYSILSRWDAKWYARIADHGYGTTIAASGGRQLSDYAFFPLFPMLERVLHGATSISFATSGLIISIVASIAAAFAIKNIGESFANQECARALVILWAIYPLSALLWMSYSESLFTALASWSLYFVMKKRWIASGLFALLAGATRPIGLALIAAVAITALLHIKRYKTLAPLSAIALAPLGWLGFIIFVDFDSKSHSIFAYFMLQRDWGNGFDGGRAFIGWICHAIIHQPLAGIGALAGLTLVLWALYATLRMAMPLPLKLYAIFMVIIALSTAGYFSSKPRYLIPAFILLAPLAQVTSRWSPRKQILIYSALTLASAIAGAFWLLGSTAP